VKLTKQKVHNAPNRNISHVLQTIISVTFTFCVTLLVYLCQNAVMDGFPTLLLHGAGMIKMLLVM